MKYGLTIALSTTIFFIFCLYKASNGEFSNWYWGMLPMMIVNSAGAKYIDTMHEKIK